MFNLGEIKENCRIALGSVYLDVADMSGEPMYVSSEGKVLAVFEPESYQGTLTEEILEREMKSLFRYATVDGHINMTHIAWRHVEEIFENPQQFIKATNRNAKIRSLLRLRKRLKKEGDPDGKLSKAKFLHLYGALESVDEFFPDLDED